LQKGVTFYDVDGNEINMDDLNDDDDSLEKRVSKWRLAIKFAKLIAKYGKRAWTYIYCVGTAPFWRCGDEVCKLPQAWLRAACCAYEFGVYEY
jgi:hypothetical protein